MRDWSLSHRNSPETSSSCNNELINKSVWKKLHVYLAVSQIFMKNFLPFNVQFILHQYLDKSMAASSPTSATVSIF